MCLFSQLEGILGYWLILSVLTFAKFVKFLDISTYVTQGRQIFPHFPAAKDMLSLFMIKFE